jgi:hypothetical protein
MNPGSETEIDKFLNTVSTLQVKRYILNVKLTITNPHLSTLALFFLLVHEYSRKSRLPAAALST